MMIKFAITKQLAFFKCKNAKALTFLKACPHEHLYLGSLPKLIIDFAIVVST